MYVTIRRMLKKIVHKTYSTDVLLPLSFSILNSILLRYLWFKNHTRYALKQQIITIEYLLKLLLEEPDPSTKDYLENLDKNRKDIEYAMRATNCKENNSHQQTARDTITLLEDLM